VTKSLRIAGILCALAVTSTYCGGGGGPAAPSPPSTPGPSPSPSPSLGPVATFAIACGSTPIDLAWSGTDTRSCTMTSTNGFDGDVALTCSGVPGASCEFNPPTDHPAPNGAASSKLTLTYSESAPFGIFDAAVRGEATTGSTTANTTVSVVRDGNSRTRHCPSASDVAAIDSAVRLVFEHDPTVGSWCAWRLRAREISRTSRRTSIRVSVFGGTSPSARHCRARPGRCGSGSRAPCAEYGSEIRTSAHAALRIA
jgi:hypothetical protein